MRGSCVLLSSVMNVTSYRKKGRSEIPSYAIAILQVFLTVMLFQIFFLTQYLTVEQPDTCAHIYEKNPIGEYQELTQQDQGKCCINGIAAKSKNAARDESVGMFGINAHAKT